MLATEKFRQTAANYLGLIRFSHTIFALPFAAMAIILAWRKPLPGGEAVTLRWGDVVAVLLCMVTARTAAMAINRLLDWKIDAANPRTAGRHLPAGLVTGRGVAALTIASSIGFIGSTALFLPNWIPLAFSLPVLLFLMGYSLAKRFTAAAHLWLGVALALSPICTWVAIRGVASASTFVDYGIPLLIAGVVATWVTGFDIIYACQDAEYDQQVGLHSIPAKLGIAGALRFSAACHMVMLTILLALAYVGQSAGLSFVFATSVAMVGVLVVYQHKLVRPDDLSRVGQAFFQTNAIISVVLLAAVVIDGWI